jgi:hypothetical protein
LLFPLFLGGGYEIFLFTIKLPFYYPLMAPRELLYYISSGLRAELNSLPLFPGAFIAGKPSLWILCWVKGEAPPFPLPAILFYEEAVRLEYTVVL